MTTDVSFDLGEYRLGDGGVTVLKNGAGSVSNEIRAKEKEFVVHIPDGGEVQLQVMRKVEEKYNPDAPRGYIYTVRDFLRNKDGTPRPHTLIYIENRPSVKRGQHLPYTVVEVNTNVTELVNGELTVSNLGSQQKRE